MLAESIKEELNEKYNLNVNISKRYTKEFENKKASNIPTYRIINNNKN